MIEAVPTKRYRDNDGKELVSPYRAAALADVEVISSSHFRVGSA